MALVLHPAAENPRSTLPEQVSQSAEIWIRGPIGVLRCSPQSGIPYSSAKWINTPGAFDSVNIIPLPLKASDYPALSIISAASIQQPSATAVRSPLQHQVLRVSQRKQKRREDWPVCASFYERGSKKNNVQRSRNGTIVWSPESRCRSPRR
jgi:hypothetical protein